MTIQVIPAALYRVDIKAHIVLQVTMCIAKERDREQRALAVGRSVGLMVNARDLGDLVLKRATCR